MADQRSSIQIGNPAPQFGSGYTEKLSIREGVLLSLDDRNLTFTNNQLFNLDGVLVGSGTVRGTTGLTVIGPLGILAPGTGATADPRYGSIHFENGLTLSPATHIRVSLERSGALPTTPPVTYGPRDVTFSALGEPVIELRGSGSLAATALENRSLTVIAAQAAGVPGTIVTNGRTPTVKPVNMPALLNYTVVDLSTNGRPDVTINFDRKPVSALAKHPAVTTKNRLGATGLLIGAAGSNSAITQALNTVTNEQIAGTSGRPTGFFDQIHAEPYSSFITTNLEMIASVRNLVFMRAMDTDREGKRVWLDAEESQGSIKGRDGLGSFSYALSTLTLGKDFGQWRDGAVGAYFTVGQPRTTEHDIVNQRLSGLTYGAGVYGQWKHSGWESRLLAGYGYGQHSASRTYTFNDTVERFNADYNSHSLQVGGRVSFDWIDRNGYELRPEVGGSYTSFYQAGFTEQGDATYGLKVASARAHTLISHVGLNGKMPRLAPETPIRPIAFVRIEHDHAKSRDHEVSAALAINPGNMQPFIGQGRGPSTAVLGVGLTSDRSDSVQIAGGLSHAWHTHGSAGSAGFKLWVLW